MKNLTEKQKKTYESLIRLGDSKELALKTVLEMVKEEEPSEMYQIAYYS